MAFKRNDSPTIYHSDELFPRLRGIGFNFSTQPIEDSPIEDALISAAVAAINGVEDRLWPMLLDWWRIHHHAVNADRMVRALNVLNDRKVIALFSGLAKSVKPVGRFLRLSKMGRNLKITYISEDLSPLLDIEGEHKDYAGSSLAVPAKTYSPSTKAILPPSAVARTHASYYWRVAIGPSYRADVWALCSSRSKRSMAAMATVCHCSLSVVKDTLLDFGILHQTRKPKTPN